ncbi:MAG TPA: aminotransferase class I/II-fold pyridoxal phosphate-dependent enzyme [Desulfosporosinus sp.]|nr:aminotransferase class I/II-fold pyridoxal phosphate-dependent enzyme [Desulfosporosinus sp.]
MIKCLNDKNFKNTVLDNNRRGKDYYYKSFKEMGLEYIPSETNFIMANVVNDSVSVSNEILKRGIAVRAGTEFGMPSWLTITIGKPEENKRLVEILKEVLLSS